MDKSNVKTPAEYDETTGKWIANTRLIGSNGEQAEVVDGKLQVDAVTIENVAAQTTAVTFHDAATVAANGATFTVGAYKELAIEIYGTSTSRTVTFYGKGPSGTLRALQGMRLSDLSLANGTANTGELWYFQITGLTEVVIDLTAVAGGNVSVKGKAVA